MSNKKPFEIPLITLGDGHVGKSSLIIKYIDDKFSPGYLTTIGFDSKIKRKKLDNGEEVKIKLFDTAGQERFRSIATTYLKKANGIILVYDITREKSFNSIKDWIEDINNGAHQEIPVVLIGNKSDLEKNRVIKRETGEELAKQYGYEKHFYETSCLTGENVNKAIDDLVEQVYEKTANIPEGSAIKIEKEKLTEKRSGCCLTKMFKKGNETKK